MYFVYKYLTQSTVNVVTPQMSHSQNKTFIDQRSIDH